MSDKKLIQESRNLFRNNYYWWCFTHLAPDTLEELGGLFNKKRPCMRCGGNTTSQGESFIKLCNGVDSVFIIGKCSSCNNQRGDQLRKEEVREKTASRGRWGLCYRKNIYDYNVIMGTA